VVANAGTFLGKEIIQHMTTNQHGADNEDEEEYSIE